MAPFRRRRSSISSARPLVAFLLIASFGILFAGCSSSPQEPEEEFTFTEEDVAHFRELAQHAEEGVSTPGAEPRLVMDGGTGALEEVPTLDLSMAREYQAIRSGAEGEGANLYRITNEFLNVRSAPSVTADQVERLDRGDMVTVLDFVDAAWARVTLPGGREGYVAQRYIAKLASEARLAQEKEQFKDTYFVDFGFLNVRKAPDTLSEKIGELPGQAFVKVLSKDNVWARITFDGKEGYVASEYLAPFLPNFLVRQEIFTLPILQYRMSQEGMLTAMINHIGRLKEEGYRLVTLRDFRDLLVEQEERDVRLEPKTIVLAVSDITPDTFKDVSDALRASNVRATIFLQTNLLGINGITEKQVLTLLANGHDIQSAAHTGDDLRSLTNAQVELELKQSRKLLEDMTQKEIFAVAYPLGGVNSRVEEKAKEAGYLLGLGAAQDRTFQRSELLNLPTFALSASSTADDVVGLVKGE
ncbi:hypothetical protein COU80_03220 [Candidatus Peregrinibacteria bacterium CG10_big_fil_rev_8_21_14_0_10_55_24]|nr:MAG: hypothetical protein COU80_03220 [Candidatus Peregrinibacteria bacterium CG10_big_fil_rev_8_21_14_0_10_55_24]